jgi:hypothetical protein
MNFASQSDRYFAVWIAKRVRSEVNFAPQSDRSGLDFAPQSDSKAYTRKLRSTGIFPYRTLFSTAGVKYSPLF